MTKAADGVRTNRVPIMFSDLELLAIDDWRYAHRVASRGAAIRLLLAMGLEMAQRRSAALADLARATEEEQT